MTDWSYWICIVSCGQLAHRTVTWAHALTQNIARSFSIQLGLKGKSEQSRDGVKRNETTLSRNPNIKNFIRQLPINPAVIKTSPPFLWSPQRFPTNPTLNSWPIHHPEISVQKAKSLLNAYFVKFVRLEGVVWIESGIRLNRAQCVTWSNVTITGSHLCASISCSRTKWCC